MALSLLASSKVVHPLRCSQEATVHPTMHDNRSVQLIEFKNSGHFLASLHCLIEHNHRIVIVLYKCFVSFFIPPFLMGDVIGNAPF
jgi:hypothetical protein